MKIYWNEKTGFFLVYNDHFFFGFLAVVYCSYDPFKQLDLFNLQKELSWGKKIFGVALF